MSKGKLKKETQKTAKGKSKHKKGESESQEGKTITEIMKVKSKQGGKTHVKKEGIIQGRRQT